MIVAMNTNTIMQMDTQLASVSTARPWLGAVITGLVVLFLAFDGVTKIIQVPQVVKASEKLGLAPNLLPGIGIVLLTCTTIYVIPKTAILGAILLTGYLGGAAAIHVSAPKRSVSGRLLHRLRRPGLGRTGSARAATVLVDSLSAVMGRIEGAWNGPR